MKGKFYPGAPVSSDEEMVNELFCDYCNCYAYAVQDYFSGHLTGLSGAERNVEDGSYFPRPGQTRGKNYEDLKGTNVRGMQRAVCEDGLLFAGKTYPKRVPDDKYVICCFLTPNEYHFLRQNQDGSWSGKYGRNQVDSMDDYGDPLVNPENYYHKNPDYPFVGYFFVPKGGIRVGVKAYEEQRLVRYETHAPKDPHQIQLHDFLKRSVQMTHESDAIKEAASRLWATQPQELMHLWRCYLQDLTAFALFQRRIGLSRRSLLKMARTRTKEK